MYSGMLKIHIRKVTVVTVVRLRAISAWFMSSETVGHCTVIAITD